MFTFALLLLKVVKRTQFINAIVRYMKGTVLRALNVFVLCLALLLSGSFFVRAHEYGLRVHYRFDSAVVDPSYLNNQVVFNRIDSLVAAGAGRDLVINTFSSPEGPVDYNRNLSVRRANALRDYLCVKYPSLAGRISINPEAESWKDLRDAVVDATISNSLRDKMLSIIDSNDAPDVKESILKNIEGFNYIYSNYFRRLRFADLVFGNGSVVAGVPASRDSKVDGDAPSVVFHVNSSALIKNYANNAEAIRRIDNVLSGLAPESVGLITVNGFSSPDGPRAANDALALKRAMSLANYIADNYPALSGKIRITSVAENWDGLRSAVAADGRLSESQKAAILNILDGSASDADKKASLKRLPEYDYLRENVLPGLRKATVSLTEDSDALADSADKKGLTSGDALGNGGNNVDDKGVKDADADKSSDKDGKAANIDMTGKDGKTADDDVTGKDGQSDNIGKDDKAGKTEEGDKTGKDAASAKDGNNTGNEDVKSGDKTGDSDKIGDGEGSDADEFAETETKATEPWNKKPIFAVTTNFLYMGASALRDFHSTPFNVGVEVPVGKHLSLYADYIATGPWRAWNHNADCAELIDADLGARWYFGTSFLHPFRAKADRPVLDGWYVGAHVGAGYYDFQRNGNGYQGEHILGAVGLGYGLTLSRHWSLDFGVSAGPMFTKYRYYEGRSNNEHLIYQYKGNLSYFGVTDAKVSLRYLIHKKENR